MNSPKDEKGSPEVAPLELPDDLKLRQLQSSSNGGVKKWFIVGAIIAIVAILGFWQLMSSSGPSANTDTHPTTTFGK